MNRLAPRAAEEAQFSADGHCLVFDSEASDLISGDYNLFPDVFLHCIEPAIAVAPLEGLFTTESGGTALFSVALEQQPTANVTVPLASRDTTEGTVSPSSLVPVTVRVGHAATRSVAELK